MSVSIATAVALLCFIVPVAAQCDPVCVDGLGVCEGSECVCIEGWEGDACDIPICADGCVHGICLYADYCACDPRWGGDVCDVCLPTFSGVDCDVSICGNLTASSECNGVGYCQVNGICTCYQPYSVGNYCEDYALCDGGSEWLPDRAGDNMRQTLQHPLEPFNWDDLIHTEDSGFGWAIEGSELSRLFGRWNVYSVHNGLRQFSVQQTATGKYQCTGDAFMLGDRLVYSMDLLAEFNASVCTWVTDGPNCHMVQVVNGDTANGPVVHACYVSTCGFDGIVASWPPTGASFPSPFPTPATCAPTPCPDGCANGGTCAIDNTCQCTTGWEGSACTVPICSPECMYGTCIAPVVCECTAGWGGAICTEPLCAPVCVHGTCSAPGVCECAAGWTGATCAEGGEVPFCPCPPGGPCSYINVTEYMYTIDTWVADESVRNRLVALIHTLG